MEREPHVHEYKRREVEDVARLAREYPVIGVVNLEGLPSRMLQRILKGLRGKVVLKYTRKSFMKFAFDQVKEKKNIEALKDRLGGIPALLFSKEEPFSLYKMVEKSMTSAPAKPGQKAPSDLMVNAGPTPFAPGPMIGELGQLGIKTEVKEGKISVKEDKLLVKAGDEITPKAAELLAKLGVEPMKLGLNVVCVYENGEILEGKVLAIDEVQYFNQIKSAHAESLALAVHLGIAMPETAVLLVQKAFRQAKAVAEKGGVVTPETISRKLAEAGREVKAVEAMLPEPAPSPSVPSPPQQENAPVEKSEARHEEPKKMDEIKQMEASLGEDRKSVVIESKEQVNQSDIEVAEKFLKDLSEKAVRVDGSVKAVPRVQQEQDISKLINQLKDQKIAQEKSKS